MSLLQVQTTLPLAETAKERVETFLHWENTFTITVYIAQASITKKCNHTVSVRVQRWWSHSVMFTFFEEYTVKISNFLVLFKHWHQTLSLQDRETIISSSLFSHVQAPSIFCRLAMQEHGTIIFHDEGLFVFFTVFKRLGYLM